MPASKESERQSATRAKQRAAGIVRSTWPIDKAVLEIIRRLARENRRTQAEVIELAVRLLDDKLASDRKAAPAAVQPPTPRSATQSKPATLKREAWWPDNANELLNGGRQ